MLWFNIHQITIFLFNFAFLVLLANAAIDAASESGEPQITDLLFLNVHQATSLNEDEGSKSLGLIVIGLFGGIVPKTASNFKQLAPIYAEKHTPFHRVIPGFVIQAGDIDGSGGHSIYGEKGATPPEGSDPLLYGLGFSGLEDENFILNHDKIGRVSVANAGPNTGGSQFFICLNPAPHLDGHHVVFGQVVRGMNVAEAIATVERDTSDKPINEVFIYDAYSEKYMDDSQPNKGVELLQPVTSDDELNDFNPKSSELESKSGKSKQAVEEHKLLKEQQVYSQEHPTGLGGSAHHYVFIPFVAFVAIAGFIAVKNRRNVMSTIRGPRYRRI